MSQPRSRRFKKPVRLFTPERLRPDGTNPHFIFVYWYLSIGGALSALYFTGAFIHGRVFSFLVSDAVRQNPLLVFETLGQVFGTSIWRVVFWLPDFMIHVVLGPEPFVAWLLGTQAFAV